MTGPEHYKAAVDLLAYANQVSQVDGARAGHGFAELVAEAQVHATLALAAATALPAVQRYYGDESAADRRWCEVTS